MKNSYFILRHGRNIHQTEKKDIVYGWPEDETPCVLDAVGIAQVEESAKELRKKGIDLIFASDILRTRQTAEIVVEDTKKIYYDERLRDINWGIFQGRTKQEAWAYFQNMEEKFNKAVPQGESWNDCRKRAMELIEEIEEKYQGKTVLLVSHGDILWLLESSFKGISDPKELLQERLTMIGVGEFRKLC